MPTLFAVRELAAAQQVTTHMSRAVDGLLSINISSPKPERVNLNSAPSTLLLVDITAVVDRVLKLGASSQAQAAADAQEAQEKAKVWSMVGCIVACVVAIVVAVVVSVFTFGAGAPAMIGIVSAVTGPRTPLTTTALRAAAQATLMALVQVITGMVQFMSEAHLKGHPIAGRFGSAMSQIADAARKVGSGADASAGDALRQIHQALLQIEKLTLEARSLPGPCLGDSSAIYQTGRALGPLIGNLSNVVQTMGILRDADARAAAAALQTAGSQLGRLTVPIRRP